MTLEQKIRPHAKYWDCYNDEPLDYNHTGKLEKVADEFAIGFGCWLHQNLTHISKDSWGVYNGEWLTVTESLEIYKKEKEL